MDSVSPSLAYHSAFPTDYDAEMPIRKTGASTSGTGRVGLIVRRRALWIAVVILASVLAPCHAPDAAQAGETFTWQSMFVCPDWLVPAP